MTLRNGPLPNDGDPLVAASVVDSFNILADRDYLLFQGLYGVMGSDLVASCSDGANIVINTQGAIRSSSRVLSGNLSPIDIVAVLGTTPDANTWYYVYGADVGGTLTAVITKDAPEQTLKYRNGNADQVFLTMFYTDGSGVPLDYTQTGRRYVYFNPPVLVNLSSSTSLNQITLAAVPNFPQKLMIAHLFVRCDNSSSGIRSITVVPHGFVPPAFGGYELRTGPSSNPGTADSINSGDPGVAIVGQDGFDYQLDGANAQATIKLMGFTF